jgi:hypothetical protein
MSAKFSVLLKIEKGFERLDNSIAKELMADGWVENMRHTGTGYRQFTISSSGVRTDFSSELELKKYLNKMFKNDNNRLGRIAISFNR